MRQIAVNPSILTNSSQAERSLSETNQKYITLGRAAEGSTVSLSAAGFVVSSK